MMPFGDVLHEADTFAFNGIGDDDGRLVGRCRIGHRGGEFRVIVPIDFAHVSTESAPLVRDRFGAHHVAGVAGDLECVAVENGDEIVELVVGGSQCRFPVRAFCAAESLSVTDRRRS